MSNWFTLIDHLFYCLHNHRQDISRVSASHTYYLLHHLSVNNLPDKNSQPTLEVEDREDILWGRPLTRILRKCSIILYRSAVINCKKWSSREYGTRCTAYLWQPLDRAEHINFCYVPLKTTPFLTSPLNLLIKTGWLWF